MKQTNIIQRTQNEKIDFFTIEDYDSKMGRVKMFMFGSPQLHLHPSRNMFDNFLKGKPGIKYDWVTEEWVATYQKMQEHLTR
jgi:hypothetical protein